MKKIFLLVFAVVGLFAFTSCADTDFDEKYTDPSRTPKAGVPQVFSAIVQKGNTWMNPVYYRYYTQSTTSGTFSGVIGNTNGRGRFRGAGEGYFNTRWQNFYDMLTQYRLLQHAYQGLPADQKPANELFYYLGRSLVQSQLHEMLSLWGDVPFSGAGTLWRTGNYEAAKDSASYDDDAQVYKQMLADLKEAGDFLGGSQNAAAVNSLKLQDVTSAQGNVVVWQKFVNSLRLRIALHLSSQGELTSDAHRAIADILNNPSKYPLIDNNSENMGVDGDTNSDNFNYGKGTSQALHGSRPEAYGSQAMLDAMNLPATGVPDANTDPRIDAIYDSNPDGQYVAYDNSLTEAQISDLAEQKNIEYVKRGITSSNYYCRIDTIAIAGYAEYQGNANLNGIWVSAAEVALSKAEAYLNGYGVAADVAKAKECFVKGVQLSQEYFWNLKLNSSLTTEYVVPVTTTDAAGATVYTSYGYINDSHNGKRPLLYDAHLKATNLAAAKTELLAYVDTRAAAYAERIWDGTLRPVATQLWLNFCFMNELEAWNVTRRTGYPLVKFARDTQLADYPLPPHRLPYPSDELNYNSVNVQKAITVNYKETTGYYTKLFWAKENYYTLY